MCSSIIDTFGLDMQLSVPCLVSLPSATGHATSLEITVGTVFCKCKCTLDTRQLRIQSNHGGISTVNNAKHNSLCFGVP
jgi:hypothetical protein